MGPVAIISSRFQEAPELLRSRGVAELSERLCFDLPDPLARHGEVLADLFQGVLAAVGEAEAEAEHLLLARRERVEDLVGLLPEGEPDDGLHRRNDQIGRASCRERGSISVVAVSLKK